ncbi:unnamed protein product [Rangifer tarandus platyrhynchus]|uniref:Uncharacterized protein n=2 Tax=Rangifer tarandus platyrhynchus TaxID=3082113 RepID=A0ACB0EJ35_RANTA|nr:unnamed protein product [Rangifer tarandus platyrhynchus]CAI9700244.1 unnamed protein product [Rangifer tarandus platyrhynchus]
MQTRSTGRNCVPPPRIETGQEHVLLSAYHAASTLDASPVSILPSNQFRAWGTPPRPAPQHSLPRACARRLPKEAVGIGPPQGRSFSSRELSVMDRHCCPRIPCRSPSPRCAGVGVRVGLREAVSWVPTTRATQGQQELPAPALGRALLFQRGDGSLPDLRGGGMLRTATAPRRRGQPANAAGCPGGGLGERRLMVRRPEAVTGQLSTSEVGSSFPSVNRCGSQDLFWPRASRCAAKDTEPVPGPGLERPTLLGSCHTCAEAQRASGKNERHTAPSPSPPVASASSRLATDPQPQMGPLPCSTTPACGSPGRELLG